jgi:arylsulfatase A-like enzyme
VPAIISWPGRLPENEVRPQVAYGCDWLPTIGELCGVKVPDVTLDGKSLVGVTKDERAPSPHGVLHWQIGKSWAVREGDWKLLFDVEDTTERSPGKVIRGAYLVNLREDPSEKTNLAAERPEIVARLRRLRALWEAGVK